MPKVLPEYKELIRLKIIESALNVFSKKGYHNSKIDEIAKEAGLSKPTLYKYVKSKEDILRAISELSIQQTEHSLSSSEIDTKLLLYNDYKTLVESKGLLHLGFEITSLSTHDEHIQNLVKKVYKAKTKAVTKLLENQQKNGMIQKELDINFVSKLITSIFSDISTQLIAGYDESEVYEYWDRAISTILGDFDKLKKTKR